jgi:hypothetical protein
MNVRSIWTTATMTSLAALLCAACGAPGPTESSSTEESAMMKGPGGGLGGGGGGSSQVKCGSYFSFDPSIAFQQALQSLGCSEPRYEFSQNGTQWSITYCPSSDTAWLQAMVDDTYGQYPYLSIQVSGEPEACSNQTPIPSGTVQVTFDPNCTGADCGSIPIAPPI